MQLVSNSRKDKNYFQHQITTFFLISINFLSQHQFSPFKLAIWC